MQNDFDPSGLSLVRQPGQVTVTVTGVSGNRRQLLLTGGIAGSDVRIEARYTLRDTSGKEQTITLGDLALVSYDRKQTDLKIVTRSPRSRGFVIRAVILPLRYQ